MRWLTEKESKALEDAVMRDAQEWADATGRAHGNGEHHSQTGEPTSWKSLEKRKLVFLKEIIKSSCDTIDVRILRPTPIALLIRAALKNLNSQSTNGTAI